MLWCSIKRSEKGHFSSNVCTQVRSSAWHKLLAHRSRLYAPGPRTQRRRLCVGAEAADRSGQGTERCCVCACACVYIWNFGGVDVQSWQPREQQQQQLGARRQGEDWVGVFLKERRGVKRPSSRGGRRSALSCRDVLKAAFFPLSITLREDCKVIPGAGWMWHH